MKLIYISTIAMGISFSCFSADNQPQDSNAIVVFAPTAKHLVIHTMINTPILSQPFLMPHNNQRVTENRTLLRAPRPRRPRQLHHSAADPIECEQDSPMQQPQSTERSFLAISLLSPTLPTSSTSSSILSGEEASSEASSDSDDIEASILFATTPRILRKKHWKHLSSSSSPDNELNELDFAASLPIQKNIDLLPH